VRVVDDRRQHLAGRVEAPRLFDEAAFTAHVDAFRFDLERLAQDAQRAVVGVQRAVDNRRDEALRIVLAERLLDHALARPRLADHDTQAALLAMHP
jgi:hypothetical protein